MTQSGVASGEVDWSVVETWSGNELGRGHISVTADVVDVDKHFTPEQVMYYRKRIKLFGPFSFAIDEHPCRNEVELQGFGFKAEKEDHNTFSWEWFNVTSPTEAVKLQEDGRLAIEIEQVSCGWEVVRTEFLTDVSLRITRFDGDPSQEPFWRVFIRKGSWIAWPPGE